MTQREFQETTTEYRKEKAREISRKIIIRSYEEYGSKDETRDATKPEQEILYCLAMGAMNAYGWRTTGNYCSDYDEVKTKFEEAIFDAILDCMEYTCMQLLPEANTYDSLYLPIKKAVEYEGL